MQVLSRIFGLVAGVIAGAAGAGPLAVQVNDSRGQPLADAVITVRPAQGAPPVPGAPPVTRTIDQRNETYIPYVEVFRPGDRVVFSNSDIMRHHVYSFSPIRSFEFVLAPGESSPPLVLDRAGIVAVGCNIHDPMIAHLFIADTPWVARTAGDGRVRIEDLPPGSYVVDAWHPQLRPHQVPPAQALRLDQPAEASLGFTLPVRPVLRRNDPERARY